MTLLTHYSVWRMNHPENHSTWDRAELFWQVCVYEEEICNCVIAYHEDDVNEDDVDEDTQQKHHRSLSYAQGWWQRRRILHFQLQLLCLFQKWKLVGWQMKKGEGCSCTLLLSPKGGSCSWSSTWMASTFYSFALALFIIQDCFNSVNNVYSVYDVLNYFEMFWVVLKYFEIFKKWQVF